MKITTTLIAGALALSTLSAFAGDNCKVPAERWQSRTAVQQMAAEQGWALRRLKVNDGCYELRATDEQGQRLKVKVDPETLRVLKIKRKERRHDEACRESRVHELSQNDTGDTMQMVANDASSGELGSGWQYFSDSARIRAVVISPDGQYYLSRGHGLRWVAGTPT